MTLFNIVSVVVLVVVATVTLLAYRRLRKTTAEAEGLGDINERGEIGTSDEGDVVGRV